MAAVESENKAHVQDDESIPTVIAIDSGSGAIRAGFSGEGAPSVRIESSFEVVYGGTGHLYNGRCYDPSQNIPGGLAQLLIDKKNKFKRRAIERGLVTHWDKMELLWHDVFQKLKIEFGDYPVLQTVNVFTPTSDREKMTQVMFESFDVPHFYVATDSPLVLYAAGRYTGIVLSSGFGLTSITPIYEGYALQHAAQKLEIAGQDITTNLEAKLLLVAEQKSDIDGVEQIKEKVCYVAQDYYFENMCTEECISTVYELPDGTKLNVGNERFKAPEIMFQPHLHGLSSQKGVNKLLYEAIMKCDVDIRRQLLGNIVLSGGNTLLPGFADRVQDGISDEVYWAKEEEIKVIAPPGQERIDSVWTGAVVLASLPILEFDDNWITKEEYQECGPRIVHKKCTL